MRVNFLLAGAAIVAVAAWMRTADLSSAPLHFDEATQARIVAAQFPGDAKSGTMMFNPHHFHGPLPIDAAVVSAKFAGEESWLSLTKFTLRIVPALSGITVVLLILASAPLIGRIAALGAAAFAAVSPFLVYYSRLFIHEDLLLLCMAGALLLLGYHVRFRMPLWTAGICLGLAATTKETFVLTPVAWAVAAVWIYRPSIASIRLLLPQLLTVGAAFLAIVVFFYSGFGTHPGGVWDFVSTYWSYQTGEGHEKSLLYYANLFLFPSHHGRLWWWQGGIFLLAIISLFQKPDATPVPAAARFCFLAGVIQAGVYSLLPYKTPWLMLVPWLHILIAAGIGAAALLQLRPLVRVAAGIALAALLAFQGLQAWRVAFKYPSDARNPFAYVPTAPGLETWTARSIGWLKDGGWIGETVSVIGPRYWPLPWYFRGLPKAGYWPTPPDGLASHALVVAMPEFAPALSEQLADSHVAIPEGLRSDTPVLLFVRKDIWEKSTGNSR
ncbi:MAG: hypothetical protein D4R65_00445 [Verrucomicrobiaceae bacterium]|nr:MAG: hypothetical protein D4R65_00445 [Verrucomicrobiaceae bacterium]